MCVGENKGFMLENYCEEKKVSSYKQVSSYNIGAKSYFDTFFQHIEFKWTKIDVKNQSKI